MHKHHLPPYKNSYEVVFINGVQDDVLQFVEDFSVEVKDDVPMNEPGQPHGTIVDFTPSESK